MLIYDVRVLSSGVVFIHNQRRSGNRDLFPGYLSQLHSTWLPTIHYRSPSVLGNGYFALAGIWALCRMYCTLHCFAVIWLLCIGHVFLQS